VTAEGKPCGAGFVNVADLRTVFGEAPVEFVQRVGVGGEVAVGTDFRDGHGDGFRVDIEAEILNFSDCE